MEYTKDVILGVQYGEVHKVAIPRGTSWKSKLLKAIKTHKIVTTAVVSAVIFVSIDVILVTNFIHILSLV